MATGVDGAIGIGKETTWGTAVASTRFFTAQESVTEDRGRLRDPMTFGTRSTLPADAGRVGITGGITQIHARPQGLGDLLRAAIGAPTTTGTSTTTGASTPYSHVFVPTSAKFSALAALPPYSATIKRGDLIHRYSGGQLNQLTLNQARDDALSVDTDWIFKGVTDVSAETISLEAGSRFLFRHLAVQKGGSAFPYLEDLTIQFNNNLEVEEVLNESNEISAVDFGGKLETTISMTLTFRDSSTYADFKAATTDNWQFLWTLDANTSLKLVVPKLQLDSWSAPINGPGRMTISVDGMCEYDSVAGYEFEATLQNDVATY